MPKGIVDLMVMPDEHLIYFFFYKRIPFLMKRSVEGLSALRIPIL